MLPMSKRLKKAQRQKARRDPNYEGMMHRTGDGPHVKNRKRARIRDKQLLYAFSFAEIDDIDWDEIEDEF